MVARLIFLFKEAENKNLTNKKADSEESAFLENTKQIYLAASRSFTSLITSSDTFLGAAT